MKLTVFSVVLLLFANACNIRPQRQAFNKNQTSSASSDGAGADIIEFVDSNDPIDNYLSIGPYLQKEFDAVDSASKTVKVYIQIRQENSVEKNFESLRELIGSMNASVKPALDSAQKKGLTTVEFEAQVAALKSSVAMINKAVSGIEISLPEVK